MYPPFVFQKVFISRKCSGSRVFTKVHLNRLGGIFRGFGAHLEIHQGCQRKVKGYGEYQGVPAAATLVSFGDVVHALGSLSVNDFMSPHVNV